MQLRLHQIIVATKLQPFRKLYLTATMASRAPMIVLDPKFRSACRDRKLKTIIATVESRTEADTKLSPDIFSVMMAEAACRCRLILLIKRGFRYSTVKTC